MSVEIPDLRAFLEGIAREAGEVALDLFGRVVTEPKGGSIVSEADRAVERLLVARIRARCPADYVLAEESGASGPARPGLDTRWWAVDPIDGTGPYLSGLPFWSISVACLRGPRVVGAAVFAPLLGAMYSAEAGGPSHRNGEALPDLDEGLPGDHSYLFVPCRRVEGLRIDYPGRSLSLAAASLHLTFPAAGAGFGAVVEPNHAYDIAAASLVLEGAGGALRYVSGREVDFAELADGRLMPEPAVAAPAAGVEWLRGRVSWD